MGDTRRVWLYRLKIDRIIIMRWKSCFIDKLTTDRSILFGTAQQHLCLLLIIQWTFLANVKIKASIIDWFTNQCIPLAMVNEPICELNVAIATVFDDDVKRLRANFVFFSITNQFPSMCNFNVRTSLKDHFCIGQQKKTAYSNAVHCGKPAYRPSKLCTLLICIHWLRKKITTTESHHFNWSSMKCR